MEIAIALFGFLALVLLWGAWEHRCINKAAEHRKKLSQIIFQKRNYKTYFAMYEAVSFEDVLRAIRWRKDPMDLYPPQFWSVLFEEDYPPFCKED